MSEQIITGPYNFVPLSEHIILPEWGELVSQDIPFRDGKDGELKITITAVSRIYVRNGQTARNPQDRDPGFSIAPDGRFFLPGTSVKGMIRNVLEIASYSRMRQISDKRYGIRDLNLKAYRGQFTETDLKSKVCAGFLDISGENWRIIPCDWASWRRKALDQSFGNAKMSAADKYLDFSRKHGTLFQSADVSFVSGTDENGKAIIPHNEARFHAGGKEKGVLVFTGQPQTCDPNNPDDKGKRREFFFYNRRENEAFFVDDESTTFVNEDGETIRRNRRDFEFIHNEQSSAGDFKAWQGRLSPIRQQYFGGCIPVFYLRDEKRLRFGLAQMFRVAGVVSTAEALRNTSADHYPGNDVEFPPDMADLIFGYATSRKALRGRVQFSACFADAGMAPMPEETRILQNPKPSFFPAYLKQRPGLANRDDYKTFLDERAELRGWKRYPALLSQDGQPDTGMKQESKEVFTHFCPLPAGTTFTGSVRYHNLREVELGALLWSLRLKNQKYHCHSIGMAKPYGFGKVKIEINGIPDEEQNRLVKIFTEFIQTEIGKFGSTPCKFDELPQIKHLLEMAKYDGARTDWDFTYMTPKACGQCKGRANIPPAVLEPYRVIRENPPKEPVRPPEPSERTPAELCIEQIKTCKENGTKVLQCLKQLPSAAPQEVDDIERIIKKTNWGKNPYNPQANAVKSELTRLRNSSQESSPTA